MKNLSNIHNIITKIIPLAIKMMKHRMYLSRSSVVIPQNDVTGYNN